MIDIEDIIVWPDGFWCYGEDLDQMTWKSDDYEVIKFSSAKWHEFMKGMEE